MTRQKTHCKRGHEYTAENTYFHRNNSRSCRACAKVLGKARYKRVGHLDATKERFRRSRMRHEYGIDTQEYQAMFVAQEGRCAICGKHQSELKYRLCVDHCHKTGAVRGLLCRRCNSGIGLLGDNEAAVLRAAAYLAKAA